MRTRVPDYYPRFRCLAGACPHSCCEGWEIVIDPASAQRYRALPGPLGERLRTALRTEDGEDFFALTDSGRCPFWDADGLCAIHRALEESATSEVCRSHPRFIEEYGPLREISLCASCPEACRLLLSADGPLTFSERRTDEPEEPADPWLMPLLAVRETAFALLADRAQPLYARFVRLLTLAAAAQEYLDADAAEELPVLCRTWTQPEPSAPSGGEGLFPRGWSVLAGLEILDGDWRALLARAERAVPGAAPDEALERIAAYFLFRYLLKTVNDGDLLGRMQFVLFSTLTVERAASLVPLPEALRLYCREIEHDEENLDVLRAAFQPDGPLPPAAFLRTLTV